MKSKTFSAVEPLLSNATSKVDDMINDFFENNSVTLHSTAAATNNVPASVNVKTKHCAYAVTVFYKQARRKKKK